MLKSVLALFLIITLSACASSPAEHTSKNEKVSESTEAAGKQKMTCRRTSTTGSRLGDKVCTPVKE